MLYDIGLKISYDYDQPVNAGRHMLRVTPALPRPKIWCCEHADARTEVRGWYGTKSDC